MATVGVPKVLVLGHSFVKRLYFDLLYGRIPRANLHFGLENRANIRLHGIGGRTVAKLVAYDLDVVRTFRPDIVVLEIGTNDLAQGIPPETVGSSIDDLIKTLTETLGVAIVCVCHVIPRCDSSLQSSTFAYRARLLCNYLEVVLESLSGFFCWRHKLFTHPGKDLYVDDVHLNLRGQTSLYRSYRGALLHALKLFEKQ